MRVFVQLAVKIRYTLLAVSALGLSLALCRAETAPITMDAYRTHLAQFTQLVQQCKAAPDTCKPEAVGADDVVTARGETRRVDYGWLRDTLKSAATPDAVASNKADDKKTRDDLLDAAVLRLKDDTADASAFQEHREDPLRATTIQAKPALHAVLAGREFHDLTQPSLWDKVWQHFFAWLDKQLSALSGAGRSSKILVRVLTYGCILIGLTLLAWWYVRQVRLQRIMLTTGGRDPSASSASALDWQKWMQQAQALAAEADWRGAVHLVYWAAISRLEALGNWPADRARTPREYLQLLPTTHRKRPDLMSLTRTFERTWYGRMPARQDDFEQAQSLLAKLVAE
jgi:hypothetical protein